jgi:hypothetical protein
MKNRLFSGIAFIILGGLIAFGPKTLFPVCDPAESGKYMKCYWTGQAEMGIGLAVLVLGIFLILVLSEQIRIGLQIAAAVQMMSAILIPSVLIGVCDGKKMGCHALTLPMLNVLGAIGIAIAVINVVYLWKTSGKG